MKNPCITSFVALLYTTSVILAQNAVPAPAPSVASSSFDLLGQTYTLGEVTRPKNGAENMYYLKGGTPKRWLQRVTYSMYPGQSDINKAMQSMIGFYKKGNHETEMGKLNTPRIVSFYAYEKYTKHHQFNVHCLHHGANGKGVIIRTFSSKNIPKNEASFRAKTSKVKELYLSKLASTKFPKFVLGKPAASTPATPAKLPELKNITEKVTGIQGKGQLVSIDEAFAKKNGAKPGGHRSFSIVVPDSELGKAMINSRPKIKDMVRLTLVGEGGTMLESIRFTGITIGTDAPMPKRLQRAASLVETHMVPKFFAGHKDGKIGMRYSTKVGPYDAACLLGRFTAQDGTILYIKFVSILEKNKPAGIMAIMLLNPTGDKPLNIKNRLEDGFAQRILHSVRLK